MNAIILMKSLIENKLHQNPSKSIFPSFFIFSVLMEILIQLKCVKIFIKISILMDFDESFDAFAPAFTLSKYFHVGCIVMVRRTACFKYLRRQSFRYRSVFKTLTSTSLTYQFYMSTFWYIDMLKCLHVLSHVLNFGFKLILYLRVP